MPFQMFLSFLHFNSKMYSMKKKILAIVLLSAFFQLASVAGAYAQTQTFVIDVNAKDEFAVLYLKMKNEFQITDAKIQLGSGRRMEVDTTEKRLRTIDNQADILNYMSEQGWILQNSHFTLNNQGNIYPFAYMVHIYRRQKKQ